MEVRVENLTRSVVFDVSGGQGLYRHSKVIRSRQNTVKVSREPSFCGATVIVLQSFTSALILGGLLIGHGGRVVKQDDNYTGKPAYWVCRAPVCSWLGVTQLRNQTLSL
jgi:hypothetical protein